MSILIQNVALVSLINNTYFEKKFTLRYLFKVNLKLKHIITIMNYYEKTILAHSQIILKW